MRRGPTRERALGCRDTASAPIFDTPPGQPVKFPGVFRGLCAEHRREARPPRPRASMSRKILLIESDGPFAEEVTSALEARGLEVRTTGDGREGYELAREWGPDAIVLCVELPGMSGYVICQKLKKDEALKSIPLVITSAEATPETFEQHRTLKVRAEDYLLKPFSPTALLASLGALIELPETSGEEPLPQAD